MNTLEQMNSVLIKLKEFVASKQTTNYRTIFYVEG